MRRGWVIVLAVWLGGPRGAAAQEAAGDDEPAFSHKGQVGLHLQGVMGYRAIVTYDEEYCGDLKEDDGGGNSSACYGRSPFGLDVGLAYGVMDRLEILLEIRLGLERDIGAAPDMDGPRMFALAPGVKAYLGQIGEMAFFSTLQLPIDFTSFDQVDKNDFGIRNVNGLQLDLHRTFGIYVMFGEEVSWRRWLRFEIEAGLGAQARFP
ncbi:MAG TPA: hypothetical protein VFU21_09640 [Kofleriaceae bacterium]|nr:hypothetical protein [Kofleriaceae bacterium]